MSTVVKHGLTFSVEGLTSFFKSGKVAKKVSNGHCDSILSAFKFFHIIQHGSILDPGTEATLRVLLKGRRNICPDMPRYCWCYQ